MTVLYGHVSSEMPNSGVKHVMCVNAQDLGNLFMGLNSLSLPLVLLRNGALMPLGHSQGRLLCRERVHPCGCRLHDKMGRSFTNKPRITSKDVAKFVFENICCRFGTPLEIISDRGPRFRGDLVKELMTKLGIKQRHSSPYYPQSNGLVENINGDDF